MNYFQRAIKKIFLPNAMLTYSQAGEDIFISNFFRRLRIDKPTYLDIGANHPTFLSNTYLFYTRGSSGVLVEPNPLLAQTLCRKRKRDKVIPVGISPSSFMPEDMDFYLYENNALNTFSEKDVAYWKSQNVSCLLRVAVPVVPFKILVPYFKDSPDFISLDAEGMDLDILKSIDFNTCRPKLICAETLGRCLDRQAPRKRTDISEFLLSKGYVVYADTYINTLFIREEYAHHFFPKESFPEQIEWNTDSRGGLAYMSKDKWLELVQEITKMRKNNDK